MSMGWAGMFDAGGHWNLWLLAGVVVLCWALVVAATAVLFGGTSSKRTLQAGHRGRHSGESGQSTRKGSAQAGSGNG